MKPTSLASSGDRWVRTFDFPNGHWKKQLPGKLRDLAVRGDLSKLKTLINSDPCLLNRRGSHGRTFLWEAVRKNRLETVQWLLERGADVGLTGCYNSESMVQLDPLTAASFYHHERLFEILKSFGASRDVFRAAFCGERRVVEHFLSANPELLNSEDPHDEIYFTPLVSFCVAGGQLDLLKLLVDRGAEVETYSSQLLFMGAHFGRLDILSLLVGQGASPLHSDATLWMATDRMDVLRLLVDAGLSPNQKPYRGLHPLMYACRADKSQNLDRVRYLVDLGADINKVGPQGRTALHYAARSGNREMCRVLTQAGADVNLVDDEGNTPLDVANIHGKIEVEQHLGTVALGKNSKSTD